MAGSSVQWRAAEDHAVRQQGPPGDGFSACLQVFRVFTGIRLGLETGAGGLMPLYRPMQG